MTSASPPPQPNARIDARHLLTGEDRAKMLSRIHSLVYWVGMLIPEHEVLGGTEVDLRELVYDLTSKETLAPEDTARVNKLIDQLRKKEAELEKRLEHDRMTIDTANGMLEEICGLLRAIDDLKSVDSPEKAEFRKKELMNRVDQAKRWQKFVESIVPGATQRR